MAKQLKNTTPARVLNYERVIVSDLTKRRRGKHHDLLKGIFDDLESLPSGSAMKIPLEAINGTSLANLRSAVHREATTRGMQVETLSDSDLTEAHVTFLTLTAASNDQYELVFVNGAGESEKLGGFRIVN